MASEGVHVCSPLSALLLIKPTSSNVPAREAGSDQQKPNKDRAEQRSSEAAGPGATMSDPTTLDRWIQELMDCKPLTESEVESLCEKVRFQQDGKIA